MKWQTLPLFGGHGHKTPSGVVVIRIMWINGGKVHQLCFVEQEGILRKDWGTSNWITLVEGERYLCKSYCFWPEWFSSSIVFPDFIFLSFLIETLTNFPFWSVHATYSRLWKYRCVLLKGLTLMKCINLHRFLNSSIHRYAPSILWLLWSNNLVAKNRNVTFKSFSLLFGSPYISRVQATHKKLLPGRSSTSS